MAGCKKDDFKMRKEYRKYENTKCFSRLNLPLASRIVFIRLCQGAGARDHGIEGHDGSVCHCFGHKADDPAHYGSYDTAHDRTHRAPHGEGDPLHRQ